MEIVCLTNLPKFTSKELDRKFGVKSKEFPSVVEFSTEDWSLVFQTVYFLQTVGRMGLILKKGIFHSHHDLEQALQDIPVPATKGSTIMSECIRIGDHPFSSEDIKRIVNGVLKNNFTIEFKHPEFQLLLLIIHNQFYCTLDLTGKDMSKRSYKIFQSSDSLKGTTAACLLEFADYTGKEHLLDPCCGSGIIPIEAALSSLPMSQFYFEEQLLCSHFKEWIALKLQKTDRNCSLFSSDMQMKCVKIAQKNAKLAGVEKSIHISRVDLEWLDTKFEKNSLDFIVTQPPEPSKGKTEKSMETVYRELFHQAEFILKDSGLLVVALTKPALFKTLAQHLFILSDEYAFSYGDGTMYFLKLKKKCT